MGNDGTDSVVNAGTPEWSGENPCILLKEEPDGPYTALMTFFRIVHSPLGRGHAAFLLLDPEGDGDEERVNACFTDNMQLARYLERNFVRNFRVFKGLPGLDSMTYRSITPFNCEGDTGSRWSELAAGQDGQVELEWEDLAPSYYAHIPSDATTTGHEIFALYVEAQRARIRVNGYEARGVPAIRDFHGRPASTAFLAFSETWVMPPTGTNP